jgi:hypothetical protein
MMDTPVGCGLEGEESGFCFWHGGEYSAYYGVQACSEAHPAPCPSKRRVTVSNLVIRCCKYDSTADIMT